MKEVNQMADVKYEIVEHIAVISDKGSGWTREVNLVKWNDGGIKVDIRDWKDNKSSMRKGITLNRQEFLSLVKSFKKIDAKTISENVTVTSTEDAKATPQVIEYPQPENLDLAVNE